MRRCTLRSHTGEVCGAMLTRTRCESHTHTDTLASSSCVSHTIFTHESLSSRLRARGLAPRSREDLVCDLDAGPETPPARTTSRTGAGQLCSHTVAARPHAAQCTPWTRRFAHTQRNIRRRSPRVSNRTGGRRGHARQRSVNLRAATLPRQQPAARGASPQSLLCIGTSSSSRLRVGRRIVP